MYFVSLKVRDRGLLRNIDMLASLEEMQDLLSTVSGHTTRTTYNSHCVAYAVTVNVALKEVCDSD
jgi:hypothetical protein